MCGGIAGALGMSERAGGAPAKRAWLNTGLHSAARIVSYAAIGAVVGGAGKVAASALEWGPALRVFAGAVILGQGLRVLGFDPGFAWIERHGLGAWRKISPRMRRAGAPGSASRALAIGAVWGLMPCGLVYTAAITAAATGSVAAGALWMMAFGLGTLPAMATASLAAGSFDARLRSTGARRTAGALLVAFGLLALHGGLAGHAHDPAPHAPPPAIPAHGHLPRG